MWAIDQHKDRHPPRGCRVDGRGAGSSRTPNGSLDSVEPRRVPPHDEVALARRHVGELLRDGLARARPGRVAVRVVARPEDVLEARLVAQLHPGTVLDEGRVALAGAG